MSGAGVPDPKWGKDPKVDAFLVAVGALVMCPNCNGSGSTYWPDDCGWCKGEGELTPDQLAAIEGSIGPPHREVDHAE